MEDDDEFGDLYTDVLQPLQTSSDPPQPPVQSTLHPPSRSIDISDRIPSDDEEILYGSKSSSNLKLDQPDQNLNLNKALIKTEKVSPAVDPGGRVFEEVRTFVEDVNKGKGEILNIKDETMEENFGIEDAGEDNFMIPGLSSSGARVLEPGGGEFEGGDDWDDSDSEDDLQIVLNDNTGVGMMGMDGGGGLNEEEGDDLVVVTGNSDPNHLHHLPMDEMKDWGEDVNQAGDGGGERTELLGGDAKADSGAAVAPKMGFGGHGYHSFHSQFKYVRPGAASIPGAGPVSVGGAPSQVRPPGGLLPFAGRGRGDWRPGGINKTVPLNMQKGFHPGYGLQGWGNNGAGRGFGTGLDFTLPSHKTIFEVDIDGFEEKPWRLQGIDMSDFFNFGMNEESWKEYCKQLEQHRLEATMQSKIRVYESGRTEQDYDPDLPPELAAAAGHDMSSGNRNIGKFDVQSDLAMGPTRAQMQLPTGKAIQVETGFGERLPSIDTRPPRMRDSDAIIEIVLQRSPSPDPEPVQEEDVVEHLKDISSKENRKDEIGSEGDRFDKPQSYNHGRKREVTRERVPHFSETEVLTINEESTESVDHKQSPSSSHLSLGSAENRSFDQIDAVKDDMVTDGNTNDNNTLKDEKSKHKMKKQKVITRAEHSSVERGEDRENSIHSVNKTRGRDDQYSHRKWESNQGYRSYPKPESYDRKKSKESEHWSRKPLENDGWKGDHDGFKIQNRHNIIPEGMQSKLEEAYRESSSRRKRERESERDDNMQREKVERYKEREKDKSWVSHTRLKEDSRTSNKDYPFKETGREPASRREKFENETGSRHRGREDEYLHENKINNEERISRYERGYSGVQDKKHKETLKRGKETDDAIHNSLSSSRRNREDNNSQKSERASSRGYIEQRANDQNPTRKSSKKHKEKETALSEDDESQESKKGRSKLERWTSHKDKDFNHDIKETDTKYKDNGPAAKLPEDSIKPPLETNKDAKPQEDKHLDTVEKLKKRSERFKLPMPSEKEALAVKKIENEPLVSAQPETRTESEVKPERPARKRRWTSG